jgi:hypothetical protein
LRKIKEFLVPLGRYMAAVVIATVLAMLMLPFVGYGTYGDRPPAGWQDLGPISARDYAGYAAFVAEFAVFLALSLVLYAALALGGVRLCEASARRRLGPVAAGALGGGMAAFLGLAGAGWYISLGALVGVIGSLVGVIAGARYLPRSRPVEQQAPAA